MRVYNNLDFLSYSIQIDEDSISFNGKNRDNKVDLDIYFDDENLGEIRNISYKDYQLSISFREKIVSIHISNEVDIFLAKNLNKIHRGRTLSKIFIKNVNEYITTGIKLDMGILGTNTIHFGNKDIARVEITKL